MEYITKSKKKAIIISSWVLVFLWMGFIFYMSAQDSTSSSSFSRPIAESVIKYQAKFHLIPTSNLYDLSYLDSVESTIRMIAHSTVFFILSVLVSLSLLLSDVKRLKVLFISISLSLLYAFVDEFHQFFVPGRASEMLDIYLDMLGILLGTTLTIVVGILIGKLHKKRFQKPKSIPSNYSDNKVIAFKPKEKLKPTSAPKREPTISVASVSHDKKPTTKVSKDVKISIPLWLSLSFIVSFSVLSAIISSNVKYMLFSAMIAFIIMLVVTIKTKFLEKNINTLNVPHLLISIILSLFTIIRVYASFRLVANQYIAEQGIVIDDLYYNFIRSGLSAFAVPAIIIIWYIVLQKAKDLVRQINLSKLETIYISLLTGGAFVALLYIYRITNVFYSTTDHHHIIFSLNSFSMINEFAYTNFTSSVNNIFQPIFSLGAMPFGVMSRILSYPLSLIPGYNMTCAEAISLSTVNALVLGITIVLFSRVFDIKNKPLFIILMTISFPAMFSLLLVSGNIIVAFYLALLLFIIIKTKLNYTPLLTIVSAGFLPFAALPITLDRHKNKFKNAIKSYVYLAICIILCSNIALFKDIIGTIKHVPRINEVIPSVLRLSFLSIFVPNGEVISSPYYVYQYLPNTISYIIGALIFIVACIGFILNRKNQLAKASMLTIIIGSIFSLYFVATLVPSGIMLYLMCFSWAFIGLIYILAEKVLKSDSWLFKGAMLLALIIIAVYNFNTIRDIVVFSFNYYTV